MTATAERHEFQAEAKQLLDLMIHSVYSNREVFLRELISNASDAMDKLRVEALGDGDLATPEDPHIRIDADADARTLTIADTGIGMSRDEVVEFIGTLAKSGSREFLDNLKEAKDKSLAPELIGQFGVGFYSSFMVADNVTLLTRRAGQEEATLWESSGDGSYTIEPGERDAHGTTITLHLKMPDSEDGLEDYLSEWKLREIVKRYSDFVTYPIRMDIERTEIERDEDGKPKEGAEEKKTIETETLNSMKAIWTRDPKDVTEAEYNEFYKHLSHDWSDPMKVVRLKAEGTFEFTSLLFIPSKAPMDLFNPHFKRGVHLYVKRVFIMDDCEELLPSHLRFVRGMVDAEDLSLNISREILQRSRQIQMIRKRIEKKVYSTLEELYKDDADAYLAFWSEFGKVVKEGLYTDVENQSKLLSLSLFQSTYATEKPTALEDYVKRMKPDQEKIYYLTGETRELVENSPHLEAFKARGYEVLLLTDQVDEVWTASVFEFEETKFESAAKGLAELGDEDERKKREEELETKKTEFGSLLECVKSHLEDHVKEVRLSNRLTDSPACLVGDAADMSPQLEQMLKAMNQDAPDQKRILELNPNHPILAKLREVFEKDEKDPRLANQARLLYGGAVLAEGGRLPDPAEFSRLVAELMESSI